MACHPILAPPAGSLRAHPPFKISLSSVSFGLQQSLVENQVPGDRRRRHRHQYHQRVGVAGQDEIPRLALLTPSSGDRPSSLYVFRYECDVVWSIRIYDQCGLHDLNCGSSGLADCNVYDIHLLFYFCAISELFPAFSVLRIQVSTLA